MNNVKNLNGTADNKVPNGYTSWLNYWEVQMKRRATECSHWSCRESSNLEGAHVQMVDDGDEWYIVPLCRSHNSGGANRDFCVDGPLAPVNP